MYESCDVPREEELKENGSEAELKASIDPTTSRHYSHEDWIAGLSSHYYELSPEMRERIRDALENE